MFTVNIYYRGQWTNERFASKAAATDYAISVARRRRTASRLVDPRGNLVLCVDFTR